MNISVLIAAYQAAPFIADALASVQEQLHGDWELIVVEDGSHDGTEALVQAFAQRVSQPVRYENLGVNRGVAVTRNRLLSLARGTAVAFLDADDRWDPTHLSIAARMLDDGSDVVVADVRAFDAKTDVTLYHYSLPDELLRASMQTLYAQHAIVTCSAVTLRATLARLVGGFDEAFCVGEDRDFWLRVALGGACFARGQMTCHHAGAASHSTSDAFRIAEQTVRFYEKHSDLPVIPLHQRRYSLAESLITLGRLTRANDPRRSATCLWKAWHLQPWRWRPPFHLLRTILRARRQRAAHSAA